VASIVNALLDGAYYLDWVSPYAYVPAIFIDRLTIIDTSDPVNPTIVGSISDLRLDSPHMARVHRNYCFITAHVGDKLTIVDVSDKTAPSVISYVTSPELDGVWGECLVIA